MSLNSPRHLFARLAHDGRASVIASCDCVLLNALVGCIFDKNLKYTQFVNSNYFCSCANLYKNVSTFHFVQMIYFTFSFPFHVEFSNLDAGTFSSCDQPCLHSVSVPTSV